MYAYMVGQMTNKPIQERKFGARPASAGKWEVYVVETGQVAIHNDARLTGLLAEEAFEITAFLNVGLDGSI